MEYSKRDRYKRIIGKLLLNGTDINLQQVKDGYAWHYKYYQKDQSKEDRVLYAEAENRARAGKIGLWSSRAIPPWEFEGKSNLADVQYLSELVRFVLGAAISDSL